MMCYLTTCLSGVPSRLDLYSIEPSQRFLYKSISSGYSGTGLIVHAKLIAFQILPVYKTLEFSSNSVSLLFYCVCVCI